MAEHGANATIVAAERVTVGGIRGFFARQYYEVTVEVRKSTQRTKSAHGGLDISARLGIAALLDDADEAESRLHSTQSMPALSTASDGFAELMDELTFATGRGDPSQSNTAAESEKAAAPRLVPVPDPDPVPVPDPVPLTRPGDLVLIIGLKEDPLTIARLMLRLAGAGELCISGTLRQAGDGRVERDGRDGRDERVDDRRGAVRVERDGRDGRVERVERVERDGRDERDERDGRVERVDDRRGAVRARARGVETGHSTFIACGLEPASDAAARSAGLTAIGADQVWVVVDASRKTEDTVRWVNMVVSAVAVHAVAALGRQFTASPHTVDDLGLPVEWMDGRVAAAPTGRRAAPPHSRPHEAER